MSHKNMFEGNRVYTYATVSFGQTLICCFCTMSATPLVATSAISSPLSIESISSLVIEFTRLCFSMLAMNLVNPWSKHCRIVPVKIGRFVLWNLSLSTAVFVAIASSRWSLVMSLRISWNVNRKWVRLQFWCHADCICRQTLSIMCSL